MMSDTAINQSSNSQAKPSLAVYADRRMLRILLLGFISGFPWIIIGTALTLWLKEDGLSRSTIGYASLIFGVYAINFWWAPLVDRIRIPFLTDKIGHRKSWIFTLQAIMLLCLIAWTQLDPTASLAVVVAVGLVIAICSATQDITIDALRIEQIPAEDKPAIAAGAAIAVVGWWTGYKLGGAIMLFVADKLEAMGHANYWQLTFVALAGIIVLLNLLLLLIPEVSDAIRRQEQRAAQQRMASAMGATATTGDTDGSTKSNGNILVQMVAWFSSTYIGPVLSFFRKNGWQIGFAILAFVFLFKIGEAFMGKMSLVFYKELGFSKSDIAIFSKSLGWITTVVFTLIGGWFAFRAGVVKALFIAGIAMACTNLMFSWLAWAGPSKGLFAAAVIVDDIAAAFATVAFVTFISLLVDRTYTATQYALLASIATFGRTTMAAFSGQMVDSLDGDWGLFFIITTLMVIPSLILLWFIRNKLNLSETTAVLGKK
jgi:PAT family beta-lactamase induction signal transducer AmpG